MAPAVAVLGEELVREIWPSEFQVGHMRGDLCLCLCQGLQWKPRHVHGSQSCNAEKSANSFICFFSKMASRAQLKQSCLCPSSAQPSTTGADFKSKTQLAVALDLINSCWDIQPMDELGVQHVCPPASFQLPLLLQDLGKRWWAAVIWPLSLLNGFVLGWESRRGVRLTRDKCVLCQVFTFPCSKATDIPCMELSLRQTSASPGCAVDVQWVWQSWARAEASSLCGTEMCVPTQTLPSSVLRVMGGDSEKVRRAVLWEKFSYSFLQVICLIFSCS